LDAGAARHDARGAGAVPPQHGSRSPRPGAVPRLPRARGPGRLRLVVQQPRAGDGRGARAAPRDAAADRGRRPVRARGVDPARAARRDEPRSVDRRRRALLRVPRAVRTGVPARDGAHPGGRRRVALAALVRRGIVEESGPPGHLGRLVLGRSARAPPSVEPARGALAGVHPYRLREGPARARGGDAPRAAQRGAAVRHDARAPGRFSAERRGRRRDDLRLSGDGEARGRGDLEEGRARHPVVRDGRRGDRDRREPPRGHRVHADRPPHQTQLRRRFGPRMPTLPGLLGIAVLALLVLTAVFADQLAPDPDAQQLLQRLDAPSWAGGEHGYLLGTDNLGRDILARMVHGARVSLTVGLVGVALSGGVGISLGLVAGYLGRRWDRIIMRVADVQQAIPALVLAIAVAAVLKPSVANLIVVLAITTWFTFTRVVRAEVLAIREMLFVEAARVVGADDGRIIVRHILPNAAASIIVIATLMVGNLILFEASLSFLGVGVPVTTPTWGRMVFDGIEYVATAWWIALVPGLAVMLTVLATNLVGDWLRDALDPRQRRR